MARTLSLLGASLPSGIMEAHPDNPVGFWESEKVADFNDEILQALDSEWDDVFAFRPRPYLSNFDRAFAGRAVELLEGQYDGAELIVLKDPRVSVLTGFWERALREAGYSTTYVIMVRNPLEVAESLRTRNSFPSDKSLLLWSSYMTAVERDTRGLPRTFVSYDDLMRDWRKVRSRIQDASGVPFPRDTPAAANEIDRFLDGRLRHHESTADDLSARGDVPAYVKTLYELFRAACAGEEVDEQAIETVHAELAKLEASVGSLVADLRARAGSLEKEIVGSREAESGALHRAAALSEQLAAQRERIADIEAAVEREQAAARDARDALLEALHDKANSEGMLNQRIAALSEELRQRDAAVAEAQGRLAEQANISAGLNDRIAAITEELRDKERAELRLNARVAALDEDLRKKDWLVREAQDASERVQAEKRSVDERLQERFGELASLTTMLAQAEAREQQARAEADWLREAGSVLLKGTTRRKGRLLALLPASFHAKRQRQLLKDLGLFNDEAYLAANPDVAAEGADPLGHYVEHGIAEDRRRG
jgi:hypothetical protein